jgi:hypothetical protein
VRELLRREQVSLGAQTVGAGAVADVAAHRAAPLRVLPRLDDVLAHAHLEAPAAPRAAAAPAGGLPPPFVRDARTKNQSDAHAPE